MPYDIIHLQRKPGFVVRKVGEARMVIPAGPRMKEYQGVITINETGAFLFELIKDKERQAAELVQALVAEYDIDAETAYKAVTAFVHQCHAAGLLISEQVEKLEPDKAYFLSDDAIEELKRQEAETAETTDASSEEAPEGEAHDG